MSPRFLSGNKGVFFSLIAVLILLLLAMQLTGRQRTAIETEAQSTETAFVIANDFINSFTKVMLPRMLEADVGTAFNAMARCLNDSATTTDKGELADGTHVTAADCGAEPGGFYLDGNTTIGIVKDAVLGQPLPVGVARYVGDRNNLAAQLQELAALAQRQLKINLTCRLGGTESINITQDDNTGPYGVRAEIGMAIDLSADVANWTDRRINTTSNVSIDRLLDPYMMQKVRGDYNPAIRFYQGALNAANLTGIVRNRLYVYEARAPSYLERFTGTVNVASSCCGIESFIGRGAGVPNSVPMRRRSMVDWCYWREHDPPNDFAWCVPPNATEPLASQFELWVLTSGIPYYDIAGNLTFNEFPPEFALDFYHIRKMAPEAQTDYMAVGNSCACNMDPCDPVFAGSCVKRADDTVDETCAWFAKSPLCP
jgi:hypothetical protein